MSISTEDHWENLCPLLETTFPERSHRHPSEMQVRRTVGMAVGMPHLSNCLASRSCFQLLMIAPEGSSWCLKCLCPCYPGISQGWVPGSQSLCLDLSPSSSSYSFFLVGSRWCVKHLGPLITGEPGVEFHLLASHSSSQDNYESVSSKWKVALYIYVCVVSKLKNWIQ